MPHTDRNRSVYVLLASGADERRIAVELPHMSIAEIREAEREYYSTRGLFGALMAKRLRAPTASEAREFDELAAPARARVWIESGWAPEEIAQRFGGLLSLEEIRGLDTEEREHERRTALGRARDVDPRGAMGLKWGDDARSAHAALTARGCEIDDIYADELERGVLTTGVRSYTTSEGCCVSLCFDEQGLYRIDISSNSDGSGCVRRDVEAAYGGPDIKRGPGVPHDVWCVGGTDITVYDALGSEAQYEDRERVRAHVMDERRARREGFGGDPTPIMTDGV